MYLCFVCGLESYLDNKDIQVHRIEDQSPCILLLSSKKLDFLGSDRGAAAERAGESRDIPATRREARCPGDHGRRSY